MTQRRRLLPLLLAAQGSLFAVPQAGAELHTARKQLVAAAASQVGTVYDAPGKDAAKIGWDRIASFYLAAYKMQALPPDVQTAIKRVGARVPRAENWSGLFCIWAARMGGIDAAWGPVQGGFGPVGLGRAYTDLRGLYPGDIAQLRKTGRYVVIEAIDRNGLSTLEGDVDKPQILRARRAASEISLYYSPAPRETLDAATLRRTILAKATAELGLVAGKSGRDGLKTNWQRLASYYQVAYGKSSLDPEWLKAIKTPGASVKGAGEWSGIFAVWALRSAGIETVKWAPNRNGWGPRGLGSARRDFESLQPGDVIVIRNKQNQHALFERRDGNTISVIVGNTDNQQVGRKQIDASQLWSFYPATPDTKDLASAVSETYASMQSGATPEARTSRAVCAGKEAVLGIDVSRWQPKVDWAAVRKAGYTFAFVKATESDKLVDSLFQTHWRNAKAAGLVRGAYHFFKPSVDPIAQAAGFVAALNAAGGLAPGDLPPVLDIEIMEDVPAATIVQRATQFLNYLEMTLGRRPIVYTGAFMSPVLANNYAAYPLWVAHYNVDCPLTPGGWAGWHLWQSSETGQVPGIKGNVDINRFNGTLEQLKQLLK